MVRRLKTNPHTNRYEQNTHNLYVSTVIIFLFSEDDKEKNMETVKVKIAKDHYSLLIGEKQRDIWNKFKVLIELPLIHEPQDIILLSGEANQLPIALDRLTREISSEIGEPHTITAHEDVMHIEPTSVVKARENKREENEKRKRQERKEQEKLKEVKGRGEETVSNTD